MGFGIKTPPEDVSSGLHLASSVCLKPRYILGTEHQLPWHCSGLHRALPAAFPSTARLLRAFPRRGEGRGACNAEGCTHGNLCPSPKAWAELTFHPDGSHQALEVEAGWFSEAELRKPCRDEPYFIWGGGGVESKTLLQILLEGVGSVASSNRALASLPLAPRRAPK